MDILHLKQVIDNGDIVWQRHALERMMERGITREMVRNVISTGEIIENYRDDTPYPRALILGWINDEPLHVVSSLDEENDACFIITAYKPDLDHFESDFKTRRSHEK